MTDHGSQHVSGPPNRYLAKKDQDQAVFMLDKFFNITRATTLSEDGKLSELIRLDDRIRKFLTDAMGDNQGLTSIALAIR